MPATSKKTGHDKLRELPEYSCWRGMWQRCTNPRAKGYENYGGRGISVCDRWRSFRQFLLDVGERTSLAYTLERLRGNEGYFPGNVVWATRDQQTRNTKRNRMYTIDGRTLCLTDWCAEFKIKVHTVDARLVAGRDLREALTAPIIKTGRPKKLAAEHYARYQAEARTE